MKYLKAALVGIVQGLTEFLPVSSSGHLTLLAKLGIAPTSLFFNLTLHLATLAALLLALRREVASLLRHPIKEGKYLLLASLPTVAVAFLLKRFFPEWLTGSLLGFGFLLTAAILFLSEMLSRDSEGTLMNGKISLFTGFMQGVAVLPGVSRSGCTISAMRVCGIKREEAARFSFLLSVPVIVGGFLLEGIESGFSAAGADAREVAIASLAAFFSGFFAVRFMLGRIKKGLKPFALYTLLLGIGCYFLP